MKKTSKILLIVLVLPLLYMASKYSAFKTSQDALNANAVKNNITTTEGIRTYPTGFFSQQFLSYCFPFMSGI
ncbi:MAG: hypothetical protein ABR936_11860 [Bacteroidota bacterium]